MYFYISFFLLFIVLSFSRLNTCRVNIARARARRTRGEEASSAVEVINFIIMVKSSQRYGKLSRSAYTVDIRSRVWLPVCAVDCSEADRIQCILFMFVVKSNYYLCNAHDVGRNSRFSQRAAHCNVLESRFQISYAQPLFCLIKSLDRIIRLSCELLV